MNALALAAMLATVAAATHAAGAVIQERLAARYEGGATPASHRPFALGWVLLHRRWWIAVALAGAASLLHVWALRYGPLTVVQPLGALTLVLALPLRAAVAGHRVGPDEWRGAALTVAGLAALLLLTASGKPAHALTAGQVWTLALVTAGMLAVFTGGALATIRMTARSLCYAVAAGIAFGVASAITQSVVVRAAGDGLPGLLGPASLVVLGFAATGLLLAQAAYRGGLGAPLATLILVNPVAAGLIGVTLLGERFVAGPLGAAAAVAAALVAAHGVTMLARPAAVEQSGWAPATLGVR